MRDELAALRKRAGNPSKGALKRHADRAGYSVGESTLIGVPTGRGGLRWATVEAFVAACLGYARARHRESELEPGDTEMVKWRTLHEKYVPPDPDIPQAGWWRSRSMYVNDTVRGLAPDELVGRREELALLHRFCADGGRFMRWSGAAYSGKTALLATLVMDPPPRTEVVAFFVNSRLSGHNDIQAFSRWTLEQLWALLGRGGPENSPVGANAHPSLLKLLLSEANQHVARYGRRLVLVVDGLDEDRIPVRKEGRERSIASLLPSLAKDGTVVICSGRSTVELPVDIDLSDAVWQERVTELPASSHVQKLWSQAEAEMHEIVSSTDKNVRRSRKVIGYIAAAGAGLTERDLEYLMKKEAAVVREALRGIGGRVLASSEVDGEKTYFFAHDLLRTSANTNFGRKLEKYRDHIHKWARRFACGTPPWPGDTPTYLRFGYAELLLSRQDLDRLTWLASDPARQQLLLSTLGGDAASLTEVTTALEMHTAACDPQSATEPDLAVLFRLAQRRDFLEARTAGLPVSLPAAWAELGEQARGRALAASYVEDWRRAKAQGELEAGFHPPPHRPRCWQDPIRQAVMDSGLWPRRDPPSGGRAEAMDIVEPRPRLAALVALSLAAADQNRAAEAAELACSAERLIAAITRYELADAMVDVLDALLATGQSERARALARNRTCDIDLTKAEDFDTFLPVLLRVEPAQEVLQRAHRAENSMQDEESRRYRRRALWNVMRWALFTHQFAAAWDAASDIRFEFWTERTLDAVAHAVVRAGPTTDDIERLVAGARSPDWERIAAHLVATGRLGDAESTIRDRLTQPEIRARALTGLAVAVGRTDPERGKELLNEVHDISAPGDSAEEAAEFRVRTLLVLGDNSRAEAVSRGIADPSRVTGLLTEVAVSWAKAGNPLQAERIAKTLHGPEARVHAFAALAVEAPEHARQWHSAAFRAADTLPVPVPFTARLQLARAAIAAHEFDAVANMLRAAEGSDPESFPSLLMALSEPLVAAKADYVLRPWFESDLFIAYDPVQCLTAAAKGAVQRGDHTAATEYVQRAVSIWNEQLDVDHWLHTYLDPQDCFPLEVPDRDWERCALAEGLAAVGDLAAAEELLADSTSPIRKQHALAALSCAYLTAGEVGQALAIAEDASPAERPVVLAALARRAADLGQDNLARRMAGRALLSGKPTRLLDEIARIAPAIASDLMDEI